MLSDLWTIKTLVSKLHNNYARKWSACINEHTAKAKQIVFM